MKHTLTTESQVVT